MEFGQVLFENYPLLLRWTALLLSTRFSLLLESLQVILSLFLETFSFYLVVNNLQFHYNTSYGFILQSMGLTNLRMLTLSQEGVIHSPGNLSMLIIQKLHKHMVPK